MMQTRKTSFIAIVALILLSIALPLQASERISLAAGTHHEGSVESRNSGIDIADDVRVDGDVRSRNGRVIIGNEVVAGDVSTRNGTVSIGRGGQFSDVSSRNGSIDIGAETRAGRISTRNGSITIGSDSDIDGEVRTRNGGIDVRSNVRLADKVNARNGRIRLEPGVEVAGEVTTRNGNIELDQAAVGRDLRTLAGDLIVRDASVVGGNVAIEITSDDAARRGGFFGLGATRSYPEAGDIRILDNSEVHGDIVVLLPEDYDGELPTVEIDASSHVHGNLSIDERVELIANGRVDGNVERIKP